MGFQFTEGNIKAFIGGDKLETRRLFKKGEVLFGVLGMITPQVRYKTGKMKGGLPEYRLKWQVGREYSVIAGRTLGTAYYRMDGDDIELAHLTVGSGLRGSLTWLEYAKHASIHGDGFAPLEALKTWQDILVEHGRFQPLSYRITALRQESLQDITEAGAIAEAVEFDSDTGMYQHYTEGEYWCDTAVDSYQSQWDMLHAKTGNGWDTNPRVWVIGIERVQNE